MVVAGDSLGSIALKFNSTVEDIMTEQQNHQREPDQRRVGPDHTGESGDADPFQHAAEVDYARHPWGNHCSSSDCSRGEPNRHTYAVSPVGQGILQYLAASLTGYFL